LLVFPSSRFSAFPGIDFLFARRGFFALANNNKQTFGNENDMKKLNEPIIYFPTTGKAWKSIDRRFSVKEKRRQKKNCVMSSTCKSIFLLTSIYGSNESHRIIADRSKETEFD